jgi:hypothetical protein
VLLIETDKKVSLQQLKKQLVEKEYFKNKPELVLLKSKEQKLSHQLIISSIYNIKINNINKSSLKKANWVPKEDIFKYAFPKTLSEIFS